MSKAKRPKKRPINVRELYGFQPAAVEIIGAEFDHETDSPVITFRYPVGLLSIPGATVVEGDDGHETATLILSPANTDTIGLAELNEAMGEWYFNDE